MPGAEAVHHIRSEGHANAMIFGTSGLEERTASHALVHKLHELYTLADPTCTSRVTVPVLWDKRERTIVSNESSAIIRMFNSAFDRLRHR
ncbi:hypothetical protein CO662_04460 [Rhizobium anhuiense]|uniref:Uncharacterized protein n=1 Tax=Rhizobium anhuiense TaxID=1184720 RepID=A0ABX4JC23_9HYPH|nr:hypothetical protein CO668_07075 [Rhizobium anhuiense]PDS52795.1 hypothetical protein CO662_04460 [Rhizobium anhuiense]